MGERVGWEGFVLCLMLLFVLRVGGGLVVNNIGA